MFVRIKTELVVDFALLRVAEDLVRFGESLELLLCGLVPRIDVWMVLARKLAEAFLISSVEADFLTPSAA